MLPLGSRVVTSDFSFRGFCIFQIFCYSHFIFAVKKISKHLKISLAVFFPFKNNKGAKKNNVKYIKTLCNEREGDKKNRQPNSPHLAGWALVRISGNGCRRGQLALCKGA